VAALNAEVTRQAQTIVYINDFYLMGIIIVVALPLLLLLRRPRALLPKAAVAGE
jgi:MFS transporter, DHA2 family, multidrug resistance protein